MANRDSHYDGSQSASPPFAQQSHAPASPHFDERSMQTARHLSKRCEASILSIAGAGWMTASLTTPASHGFPILIQSDFGWSAATFSRIVIQQYGDESGEFSCAYASFMDETPPAYRINVTVLMIPYWFALVSCLPSPILFWFCRLRTTNRSVDPACGDTIT